MDPIQQGKRDDENKVGTRLAHETAAGLGIPHGTPIWAFPKKPLGKPDSAKGTPGAVKGFNSKAPSRQGRAVRSHSRSRPGHAKKKGDPLGGGFF